MTTPDEARTVVFPAPFPYQQEILDDAHRIKVLDLGRQAGKTTVSGLAIFYGHGPTMPDGSRMFLGAFSGKFGWWIAPTYDLASIAWRRIKRWLAPVWDSLRKSETMHDRWVEFPGGGRLAMKSADDPEKLVGETLDFLLIDEAAKCKLGTWELAEIMLTIRHTERLRGTNPGGGWALIISTPKQKNWFYRLWLRGQSASPDYRSWQLPSTASPLFSAEEDARYRRELSPFLYQREILAQFVVTDGAYFRVAWFREREVPSGATFLTASLPIAEDTRGELGPTGLENERPLVVATWVEADGLTLKDLYREKVAPAEMPKIISDIGKKAGASMLAVPHLLPFAAMAREVNKTEPLHPMALFGIYDAPDAPTDDAERVAHASSALLSGRLRFKAGASWMEDVRSQLCSFPDPDEERSIVEAIALAARARPCA